MATEDREAARRQRLRDAGILGEGEPRVTLTGGVRAYELRDFLTRNRIPFAYRDEGAGDVAVCAVAQGPTLHDPSIAEVAEALHLRREPSRSSYDLLIVGAGPAGLAAGLYGASEGLSTAVVERFAPRWAGPAAAR